MANVTIGGLVADTTPSPTDLVESEKDPAGVPASKKVTHADLVGGVLQNCIMQNLIKNSPGQIAVDGAEPQWWDDVANATITDEDCAGEAIADKFERAFKVVTSADDVYGYQTFTFADEDLLDAGVTVVSLSCWVYCADAAKASIGIYGTNLSLQESAQHGGSGWELLTVENITLNASDTSIQVRLIVDTGTAYFAKPMLNVGPKVLPWQPRRERYVTLNPVAQLDLNTTGDVAWTDTDCTANTHALATMLAVRLYLREPDGTAGSYGSVATPAAVGGSDSLNYVRAYSPVANQASEKYTTLRCDDSQVIRYFVSEEDADSDVRFVITLTGYWRWE